MDGFRLSGLASGMDTDSIVQQLLQLERIPQSRIISQKSNLNSQVEALDGLKDLMRTLDTSMGELSTGTALLSRSTTIGSEDGGVLSASASAGANLGEYSFTVESLATSTVRAGGGDVGGAISATADVSGVTLLGMNLSTNLSDGTFSVNGASVTVDLTDSLQDVFDAISTATGGEVTASYDPATDAIQLSSAGEVILGMPTDTSNFLTGMRLYSNGSGSVTSARALGSVDKGATLAEAGLATAITNTDVDGNGSFLLNGVSIAFNVNSDTVEDVVDRVNSSDAGVQLSYDSVSDSFNLENTSTGGTNLTVSEDVGGLLEAFGLNGSSALTLGANATFRIDGGALLQSSSNVLTSDVTGIEGLSVTAESLGTDTVKVGTDTEHVREKLDKFIEDYNAVQDYIDQQTSVSVSGKGDVSAALLSRNGEVKSLARTLRTELFKSVQGLGGGIKRLQDIGIDFARGSDRLSIKDGTKLDEMLKTESTAVDGLFNDDESGLFTRLNDLVDKALSGSGNISNQQELLGARVRRLDSRIDYWDRIIDKREKSLLASFRALEQAQLSSQRQMDVLLKSFG